MEKKKIVVLTGAGISVESGLTTFRDANGLWENYNVEDVASHEGWLRDPVFVNNFYNMLRTKYRDVKPCEAHLLLKKLEEQYDVTIVTQNVDNLHEMAGSEKVIHLHGEMMKMCSSRDVENPRFWISLPHEGWPGDGLEIPENAVGEDGALIRPYIVFFGESVPNMYDAMLEAQKADIFIIIGTSLNVYPAAGLVAYAPASAKIYLIDPKAVGGQLPANAVHLMCGASEGMRRLAAELLK